MLDPGGGDEPQDRGESKMGMVELFVPMAAFTMVAVVVSFITRLIATAILNKTIREAIRSDPASVPLLAERLEARQPWADSLLGWIFLAFALALLILGVLERDPDEQSEMYRAAVIPIIVGATVLLYTRFARPKTA
jgi:quinol-cytochrome oxidoreductase complex cytochrome b subunit